MTQQPEGVPAPTQQRTEWTFADFLLVLIGGFAVSVTVVMVYAWARTRTLPAALIDDSFLKEAMSPEAVTLGLFGQILANLALVGVRGVTLRRSWERLRLKMTDSDVAYIAYGLFLGFLLAMVFGPLADRLQVESGQGIADVASAPAALWVKIGLFSLIGLAGPVAEEVAFRGVLLSRLERSFRPRTAIGLNAAAFATIHILDFGDQLPLKLLVFLPQLLIVGLVLAYLTIHHRRLGPAIFTHIGFNLLTVAALLITVD